MRGRLRERVRFVSVDYAEVYRLAKKGRKAEQRGKALEGCFTALIGELLKGWLFMLAIGVAHAHWWPAIPTIGFWWSLLFVWLLPSFGGSPTRSKSG